MKCNDCGKEIENSSEYCDYCGFKINDNEKNEVEEEENILNISKNNEDVLKETLQEKNERIESLKKDIYRTRINENRKSKSKITVLIVILLVSLFVIIVLSARLSVSFRYANKLHSKNIDLLSINEELENENRELSKKYIELEDENNLLIESSNEDLNNNSLEEGEKLGEVLPEQKAPKAILEIHEGPFYDESTGICYYRIIAIVTGNPKPEIIFSKDDSDGAWGKYIAQVNLTSPDETYELTVMAKNNLGEARDSLVLNWGCNN